MRTSARRVGLVSAFSVTAALLTSLLFAAPKQPVKLCFEAEAASGVSGKVFRVMKYTRDPMGKVSNNQVLAIPKYPPGEKVPEDEVTYRVKIPEAGVYYLWVRAYWSTGCGNSFSLKMEDYPGESILGGDATYDVLHWLCLSDGSNTSKPRPLQLKQGAVTLTLGAKESGARADQFLLTTDRQYIPAGVLKVTPDCLDQPAK